MVLNNQSYEEQTLRLLAETKAEIEAVEARKRELDEKLAVLTKEAHGFEVALAGYRRRTGRQPINEPDWDKLLKDLKHKDKLVTIAKHSGGKIRVRHAADLLYSKGFIKSKRRGNAYTIVQNLLAGMIESGVFERLGLGEYKLVTGQPVLPGINSG